MSGKIVNATSADILRVEFLGEGRAVQIPAECIVAVDTVLRFCLLEEDYSLSMLGSFESVGPGWSEWQAYAVRRKKPGEAGERIAGRGDTPWAAIVALAKEIEARRNT